MTGKTSIDGFRIWNANFRFDFSDSQPIQEWKDSPMTNCSWHVSPNPCDDGWSGKIARLNQLTFQLISGAGLSDQDRNEHAALSLQVYGRMESGHVWDSTEYAATHWRHSWSHAAAVMGR